MRPKITVGIPVWNAERTLASAVESVMAQTFADWELLILDDGSSDRSRELAGSMGDRPRIRVIGDGVNRGLVYRLNQMIELASAPLFARMDADDLMHPERLREQWQRFEADGALEICGTAVYVMDAHETVYGVRCDDRGKQFRSIRQGFIHPTVMARTGWLRRNPYDAAYPLAEDAELWQRVDEQTRCVLIPRPLLFYRDPLTPQVSKYRASCRTMRRIARRYGPERRGWAATLAEMGGLYAKEVLYRASAAIGTVRPFIRQRNRACTDLELQQATVVLEQLRRFRSDDIPTKKVYAQTV